MERLIRLLSLKPIILGLIAMLISGATFPLAGVLIIRNSLIPMRYMLMHGVILGGIFSIALGLPLVPVVIVLNLLLVLIMAFVNKERTNGFSAVSTAMMVCTMGLASMFSHIFDVPAKDTLELLWGSPFALTRSDLCILAVLAVMLVIYVCIGFKQISMVFFDRDIAQSMGVNVRLHNFFMLLVTALVISIAMKMIGALLIDALVVLPVVAVGQNARGLKNLFVKSSVTGFVISLTGYFTALLFNLPVSGVLAILSILLLIFYKIIKIGNRIGEER